MGALEILTGGWNLLKMGFSALADFLKSLNPQGVIGLLVALILTILSIHEWSEQRHWHKQSDRYEALYNAELAHEQKIAKQAVDLKTRIDALSSSITTEVKDEHDAEDRRIASDADTVRLRGPGKAACTGDSSTAAAAVRPGSSASANAGPQMSPGDRATVPWDWLVTVVEEHDQLLNKVKATEDQHDQLEKAWPPADEGPAK
jgi:hypothetical protein